MSTVLMPKSYNQFGIKPTAQLGIKKNTPKLPPISTGIHSIDIGSGSGGLPRGRIVEIYGYNSVCKTIIALHTVAAAQKTGIACYIDADHAIDTKFVQRFNVNPDTLLVAQPETAEDTFELIKALIKSNEIDLIVLDSIAALVPKEELSMDLAYPPIGLQSQAIQIGLEQISGLLIKSKTSLLIINQVRHKIIKNGYKIVSANSRSVGMYASIRIIIKKLGNILEKWDPAGIMASVSIIKNTKSISTRETRLDILFKTGISRNAEILDLGIQFNLINRNGNWYEYNKINLGQGRINSSIFIGNNPDIAQKILTNVYYTFFNTVKNRQEF